MKTYVEIFIRSEEIVSDVMRELRSCFPEGKRGAGFRIVLSPTDPTLQAVLKKLADMGVPRVDYSKKERAKDEYILDYRREYELGDDEQCEYLWLKHETLISEDQVRDDQGRLVLKSIPAGLQIGCVLFNASVISRALRDEITKAGLIGCEFKPLVNNGVISDRFFELTSSILLPPMPRERLVLRPDSPNDYTNVSGISDGEFLEKELHFSAKAMRKIEPFDFALTYEVFSGERWQVASQRFRQFCVERRVKMSWIPVRLDDD